MSILEDIAKGVAQAVGKASPVASYFLDWGERVARVGALRYGPILMAGRPCDLPTMNGQRCPHPAVGTCAICHKWTCLLEHSLVASNADIVCVHCVNEFAQIKGGGKVEPEHQAPRAQRTESSQHQSHRAPVDPAEQERRMRIKALRTLGLSEHATWDEISAAFKQLAAKHHPDKQRTTAQKAAAHKRFVDVNSAYQFLQKRRGQEAA